MQLYKQLLSRVHSVLRWSERYTKTDMVYLATNSFWLTAEQILFGFIALGVSVAFAHFVPPNIYGTYRFLLSLYWILTAFTLTGIPSAMSRAVARGEEGAYKQSFRTALLGAIPMSVIALGVSAYYFLHDSPLAWGALAIAIIGPFFQAGYLYAPFLEGKKNFKSTAILGLILNAIPALILLSTIPFVRNPLIFFLIYLTATAATGLTICVVTYIRYKPNNVRSRDLVSLGGHLSAMNILNTLANQIDQLLIFHSIGAAPLAVYSFATTFPDQIKAMFNNITNVAFPKLVRRPIAEIQKTMVRRVSLLTVAACVTIGLYIVAAPYIFKIFFPTYMDAVFYSQLYALALVAVGNSVPLTTLQAHAAKKQLYIYNVSSGLFQIITLVIGAVWFGIVGVIVARIVSRILNLLVSLVLVRTLPQQKTSGA